MRKLISDWLLRIKISGLKAKARRQYFLGREYGHYSVGNFLGRHIFGNNIFRYEREFNRIMDELLIIDPKTPKMRM